MSARFVLSGGIGSGKSSAGEIFSSLGAVVFSADDFARRVLAPGSEATERVIELWPEVASGGAIDRIELGRLVFGSPEQLHALESITHPPTRRDLLDAMAEVPESEVVIVEMPILRDWFDGWMTVVVDAPEGIRVARVLARDDRLVESDIRAIMARQPSRSEWLLAADFVIDNSADEKTLERGCRAVWERLTSD